MTEFERITVPSDPNLDEYKDNTTWKDGKCVSMDEGDTSLMFYDHEIVTVPQPNLETESSQEEVQIATAIFVRVSNPVTEKKVLDMVKQTVKQNIKEYDTSDHVNEFYCQGRKMWLDKATRSGLMLRLSAESNAGAKTTTLWYGTHQISLPIENAINMLNLLELYASKCYDNTQGHLAAIEALETVEEVLKYDYTSGYPDKLEF